MTYLLENLKLNIAETVGYEFEIIAWNNLTEQKPITEVYNLLAAKAKYPYWCFIHEDIRFDTVHWAVNLIKAFDESSGNRSDRYCGSKV